MRGPIIYLFKLSIWVKNIDHVVKTIIVFKAKSQISADMTLDFLIVEFV